MLFITVSLHDAVADELEEAGPAHPVDRKIALFQQNLQLVELRVPGIKGEDAGAAHEAAHQDSPAFQHIELPLKWV